VVGDRLEHEVPGHGVKERPDVHVDHPARPPAPLPTDGDRVQRGLARPVSVGIRMKDRLDLPFQIHPHHRLSNPVGHRRHAQHPNPFASRLGDLHRLHRRREVRTRREPVPDLVQIPLPVPLELGDRLLVDARRALVGLDFLVRFPDHHFGDLKRLVLLL